MSLSVSSVSCIISPKTSALLISSLGHGFVHITSGLYVSNSRNRKSYCKYSCSLPAPKPMVYPQSWVPLLQLNVPPLFHLQCSSSLDLSSPYHSHPSSRPMSNVLGLSSSPSPLMSPCWKSRPPDIVTQSSSSIFHPTIWVWKVTTIVCATHSYLLFTDPTRHSEVLWMLKT